MNVKPDPEMIDAENLEWTDADFAQAVSFAELPPPLRAKLKGGRPKVADPKTVVTLRLRASVLAAYEARGPDWRAVMERVIVEGLVGYEGD